MRQNFANLIKRVSVRKTPPPFAIKLFNGNSIWICVAIVDMSHALHVIYAVAYILL